MHKVSGVNETHVSKPSSNVNFAPQVGCTHESETAVGMQEADSPIKVWYSTILLLSPCGFTEGSVCSATGGACTRHNGKTEHSVRWSYFPALNGKLCELFWPPRY